MHLPGTIHVCACQTGCMQRVREHTPQHSRRHMSDHAPCGDVSIKEVVGQQPRQHESLGHTLLSSRHSRVAPHEHAHRYNVCPTGSTGAVGHTRASETAPSAGHLAPFRRLLSAVPPTTPSPLRRAGQAAAQPLAGRGTGAGRRRLAPCRQFELLESAKQGGVRNDSMDPLGVREHSIAVGVHHLELRQKKGLQQVMLSAHLPPERSLACTLAARRLFLFGGPSDQFRKTFARALFVPGGQVVQIEQVADKILELRNLKRSRLVHVVEGEREVDTLHDAAVEEMDGNEEKQESPAYG
eukprot:452179-Prymnesium_polylepis.2